MEREKFRIPRSVPVSYTHLDVYKRQEFALRISGTAAKNFFIFAQAVLHDSKKTHGKTHLIRLLKEQKPLKFFTVDKDRMHDFARAAKAHGLLFCPIRDKMDPDHIEIAILQDDASKANRIIDKLQLAIVDTGCLLYTSRCV